jgi:hypothetical protein
MKWKLDLPTIKKGTRDNLGLIVAVLAALFAGWSGYEAHVARVKADEAAKETIKLQADGVEAQKEATRLDERPYIFVIPSEPEFEHQTSSTGSSTLVFKTRLKLLTSGRMPALEVSLGWDCDEYVPGTGPLRVSKGLRAGTEDYPEGRMQQFAYATTSGSGGERSTDFCPPLEISHGREQNPLVFIVGQVTYKDYFEIPHPASFCFEGSFPEKLPPRKTPIEPVRDVKEFQFIPCSSFHPKFK